MKTIVKGSKLARFNYLLSKQLDRENLVSTLKLSYQDATKIETNDPGGLCFEYKPFMDNKAGSILRIPKVIVEAFEKDPDNANLQLTALERLKAHLNAWVEGTIKPKQIVFTDNDVINIITSTGSLDFVKFIYQHARNGMISNDVAVRQSSFSTTREDIRVKFPNPIEVSGVITVKEAIEQIANQVNNDNQPIADQPYLYPEDIELQTYTLKEGNIYFAVINPMALDYYGTLEILISADAGGDFSIQTADVTKWDVSELRMNLSILDGVAEGTEVGILYDGYMPSWDEQPQTFATRSAFRSFLADHNYEEITITPETPQLDGEYLLDTNPITKAFAELSANRPTTNYLSLHLFNNSGKVIDNKIVDMTMVMDQGVDNNPLKGKKQIIDLETTRFFINELDLNLLPGEEVLKINALYAHGSSNLYKKEGTRLWAGYLAEIGDRNILIVATSSRTFYMPYHDFDWVTEEIVVDEIKQQFVIPVDDNLNPETSYGVECRPTSLSTYEAGHTSSAQLLKDFVKARFPHDLVVGEDLVTKQVTITNIGWNKLQLYALDYSGFKEFENMFFTPAVKHTTATTRDLQLPANMVADIPKLTLELNGVVWAYEGVAGEKIDVLVEKLIKKHGLDAQLAMISVSPTVKSLRNLTSTVMKITILFEGGVSAENIYLNTNTVQLPGSVTESDYWATTGNKDKLPVGYKAVAYDESLNLYEDGVLKKTVSVPFGTSYENKYAELFGVIPEVTLTTVADSHVDVVNTSTSTQRNLKLTTNSGLILRSLLLKKSA